jgi:hypothetical protein
VTPPLPSRIVTGDRQSQARQPGVDVVFCSAFTLSVGSPKAGMVTFSIERICRVE